MTIRDVREFLLILEDILTHNKLIKPYTWPYNEIIDLSNRIGRILELDFRL